MKKRLIILIILLVTTTNIGFSQEKKNDLSKSNLKGNVAFIETENTLQ